MNNNETIKNGSNGSSRVGNIRRPSPSLHWCFTWNNPYKSHISIEKFITLLESGSNGSKKYVFQEEIGDSGTEHLQGYVKFCKKVRPLTKFKDITCIYWEKCRSPDHSIAYCSDPDKRKENGRIWSRGIDLPEALVILPRTDFYPWQERALSFLQDNSDRTIYWIWESNGNVGKSSFVKYLCVKHNALLLSGKGSDIKYGVVKFKESTGLYPRIIVIDIPRTVLDYVSYSAIEEVKNGCFFSGKYEGQMCLFNSPVILCFANETPKTEKMSLDRWKIFSINDKKLY